MKRPRLNPEAARRERLRRDRLAAKPMRRAYPNVALLRLELKFDDGSDRPPAAQLHTLHPPAEAFFRFPCAFADCDGEFNLAPMVDQLVAKGLTELTQRFECQGVRARDRATGHKCRLALECTATLPPVPQNIAA